jgi:hypothetical protein
VRGMDLVERPACGKGCSVFLSADFWLDCYGKFRGDIIHGLMHRDMNGSKTQLRTDLHPITGKLCIHSREPLPTCTWTWKFDISNLSRPTMERHQNFCLNRFNTRPTDHLCGLPKAIRSRSSFGTRNAMRYQRQRAPAQKQKLSRSSSMPSRRTAQPVLPESHTASWESPCW